MQLKCEILHFVQLSVLHSCRNLRSSFIAYLLMLQISTGCGCFYLCFLKVAAIGEKEIKFVLLSFTAYLSSGASACSASPCS